MDLGYAVTDKLQLDSDGRIDQDINCLHCGYNLRGLLPDGRCPECGIAVGKSAHGGLLRFCDPDWVGSLASGTNWIMASIVVGILLGVGAMVVASAAGKLSQMGEVQMLVGIAVGLITLIGYWKVTAPDPQKTHEEPSVTARSIVRVTAVTTFCLGGFTLPLAKFSNTISVIVTAVSGILGVVQIFAVLIYAGTLAVRIPDRSLAKSTRIVMWGLGSVAVLGMVGMGLGALYALSGPATTTAPAAPTVPVASMSIIAVFGCFAGLGYLVFGLWALRLLSRYRKAFRQSAQLARETWAREVEAVG